ncbi:uncharacterized protein M6B38_207510 [Iris pallida]|uniref:Uncharacterized protein n=1 Tax=Iris pallida TaxID=29817 RepID=A0AAX6E5J7_IRIPA|nr:uncharacterized protein M6B38_207510 [Iris pallida]
MLPQRCCSGYSSRSGGLAATVGSSRRSRSSVGCSAGFKWLPRVGIQALGAALLAGEDPSSDLSDWNPIWSVTLLCGGGGRSGDYPRKRWLLDATSSSSDRRLVEAWSSGDGWCSAGSPTMAVAVSSRWRWSSGESSHRRG